MRLNRSVLLIKEGRRDRRTYEQYVMLEEVLPCWIGWDRIELGYCSVIILNVEKKGIEMCLIMT